MTDAPYVRVHLDEIETLPASAALAWKPIRRRLGVRAFGINAYTAANAGGEVVEDHDENDTPGCAGHEEVYVVLTGRATFTVAGDELDAPAGTLVFVGDPAARRHAVAAEAGTTVLAIGGGAGRPYEVSAWEHSYYALAHAKDDPDRAVAVMREGVEARPGDARLLYDLACVESLAGRPDDAVAHLRQALEADPALAGPLAGDTDLDPIREHPDFPA